MMNKLHSSSPPSCSISKMATCHHEQSDDAIPIRVLALYKFVAIPQSTLPSLQAELEEVCRRRGARGTLLIAPEGINGTICYPLLLPSNKNQEGDGEKDDPVLHLLQSKFDNSLRIRLSQAKRYIFARLKVKIKSEIVTLHQDGCSPTTNNENTEKRKGDSGGGIHYVKPQEWNRLLTDPDCLVIDTRNTYEIEVGTFHNAINPQTQSFVDFPDWMATKLIKQETKDNEIKSSCPKKIAMFCTGGIRCEKATYACRKLLSSKEDHVPVYHLEGGILAYLDDVLQEESMFEGECYVFDQRIAVTYGNQSSVLYQTSCYACRHPLSTEDLQHPDYVEGLSCSRCISRLTEKQVSRFEQRQRQIRLAQKDGRFHIHDAKEHKQTD